MVKLKDNTEHTEHKGRNRSNAAAAIAGSVFCFAVGNGVASPCLFMTPVLSQLPKHALPLLIALIMSSALAGALFMGLSMGGVTALLFFGRKRLAPIAFVISASYVGWDLIFASLSAHSLPALFYGVSALSNLCCVLFLKREARKFKALRRFRSEAS